MSDLDRERELLASPEHVCELLATLETEEFVSRVAAATRDSTVTMVGDKVWPAWPSWLELECVSSRDRGCLLLALADEVPLPAVAEAARHRPRVAPERIASAFRVMATSLEESDVLTANSPRMNVLGWLVEYATSVGHGDTIRGLREWVCWLVVRGIRRLDVVPLTRDELELVARNTPNRFVKELLSVFGLSCRLTEDERRRAEDAEARPSRPALPLDAALAAARDALSVLSDHVSQLGLSGHDQESFMEEKMRFEQFAQAE
jgi:hypothetical protein